VRRGGGGLSTGVGEFGRLVVADAVSVISPTVAEAAVVAAAPLESLLH